MITAKQIRAARALLDWKQSDLAKRSGLSLPAINAIERNAGSPRLTTLATIQRTLGNAGVTFLDNDGVCLPHEIFDIRAFQGDDFIARLNDDLFSCMRGPDDVVMMFGLDERQYPHYPEQMLRYYYHQKATGFTERILVAEGDDFFLSPIECYRWTFPQARNLVPYYVYHDRVAMIMWDKQRTIIIRSQDIADSYRTQFGFLWDTAKPVPAQSVTLLDDPAYRGKFEDK